jgi:hypothetical protein
MIFSYFFFQSVVALFNAIAKTKKEAAQKEAAEKSKEKSEGDEISFYSVIKKC